MKLQLTLCVLSLVILTTEAGLFRKKKYDFDVNVKLGTNDFEKVTGGILLTVKNYSREMLGFIMGPNLNVGKSWHDFPINPDSSIESVTLGLLAEPSGSTKPQFVLVDSVTIESDERIQKFCSTNQRLEEHKPLTFHKC